MAEGKKVVVIEKEEKKYKYPSTGYAAVGKRKNANARIRLVKGSGNVLVGRKKMSAKDYFKREVLLKTILKPLLIIKVADKYDVLVNPRGGGLTGQADATAHGIARALISINPDWRKMLKDQGLLTRDPRVKERKKYGRKRARKTTQYRKR